MPLKFEFKRLYSSLSERVKCTELHPTEPWILVALYSGQVFIHNYETQTIIKTFDIGQVPIRAAVFVVRKNWVVCGGDDLHLRVFNYNTLDRVHSWEAHIDYIRGIAAHSSRPLIISCSDDMLIKVWDWDRGFTCVQTLEGHYHFVMQVVLNPKDNNQLASASLDRKIKVWLIGVTKKASFTLEGHEKGVNGIDYCRSGDRPYLVSSADDWTVRVWDYQNKSCVHVLSGHSNNVIRAVFHPNLPIIISASEDGTARVWNAATFRCDLTLNFGMGRMWSISSRRHSNEIVFGYDDGILLLRAGREAPTCCMDVAGRVFLAKQNHIFHASAKNLDAILKDGEPVAFSYRELGTSEIYPHSIIVSPNGRFIAVVGDGEFAVYTTVALRSKIFGAGDRLAWAADSVTFSTREGSNLVLYRNSHEQKRFNPGFMIEELFSGALLGAKSPTDLYFFEWSELYLIIKIDVLAHLIVWNREGSLCSVGTPDLLHVLKYNSETVSAALNSEEFGDYGVLASFEPIADLPESVLSGTWVGDCFVFTNKSNRIAYLIGTQTFTLHHVDKPHFVVGYVSHIGRLFLANKDGGVISFGLEMRLIEYEIAILNGDLEHATKVLPSVPPVYLSQLALFLENQGHLTLAQEISPDLDHRFDLAMRLKSLDTAAEISEKLDNPDKWRTLGKVATAEGRFDTALTCYRRVKDVPALLLLAYALNSRELMDEVLALALELKSTYIAFIVYYITGRVPEAVELLASSGKEAEAAVMTYAYAPDLMESFFERWQDNLRKTSPTYADRLAHPSKYPNLFPHSTNLNDALADLTITEPEI